VYTSHVLDEVTKHSDAWNDPDCKPQEDSEIRKKMIYLGALGNIVEEAVEEGRLDLTVMIRSHDHTESTIRHEAVGCHYILAAILRNLQRGVDCAELFDVYKEYIERLVSVLKTPRSIEFSTEIKDSS
jgi:predicted dinucleotide-utilizing enzyme